MNDNSAIEAAQDEAAQEAAKDSPILVVPYMWIGDFVRCHSVIKLLKARYPRR